MKSEVQAAAATAAAAQDRALSAAIEGLGKEAMAALRESDAAAARRDDATRAAVQSEVLPPSLSCLSLLSLSLS